MRINVLVKGRRESYVSAFEHKAGALAYMKNCHPNGEWELLHEDENAATWQVTVEFKSRVYRILFDMVN